MNKTSNSIKHLKKDKILNSLIGKHGEIKVSKDSDAYLALLKAITSQQLSNKAAETIWKRFTGLFNNGYPSPEKIKKMKPVEMREVGLSFQKAGYIKNIAEFYLEGHLHFELLESKSDEDLITHLTKIKGVGKWTVEMLMMFSLNREDVFPIDDLGIQNGMKKLYSLNDDKKKLKQEMILIAEKWRPHRTLASLYIWKFKDGK